MKRLVLFLLLFAAIKVAGQTTGYLRFDTVRIFKQGGTAELIIINKTKDTIGLLTNVGGGYTRFIKPKVLNDSTLVVGLDTLTIRGTAGGGGTVNLDSLRNATQLRIINGSDTTIFEAATESLAGSFPASDKFKVNRWEPYLNFTDLRTKTNLDTSVIYVDKKMNWFRYDASDASSADDTAMVIVTTGGGRLKRVFEDKVYPEYFGAKGDNTTDDAYAFQKMFNWLATSINNYEIGFKSKNYKINTRVTLPLTLNANQSHEFLLMHGYGTIINTDSAISIFFRQPLDGLLTQPLSDYKLIVRGLSFRGTATTGQKAIEFGATYGSEIVDCHFNQFDTALSLRFWLKGRIANCFFTGNKTMGIYCGHYQGMVTGATIPNSAFNSNIIENCRFHNLAGSFCSVMMIAADAMMVRDCVSEGVRPRYNFYYDFDGSVQVNTNTFENIWIETGTGTTNTNFYLRPSQQLILRNIQRIHADTLFQIAPNPGANTEIIIEDIPYMGNLPARPFHANSQVMTGSSIKFRNIGYSYTAWPLDSTKWVGGIIPTNVESHGEIDANGGFGILSSNVINLQPRYNVGAASRYTLHRGGLLFADDNTYYIGGVSANNRPFRLNLGTGGLRVDPSGTVGFGDAATTPTVTISRPGTNILGFSTASTERARFNASGGFQLNTTASTGDIIARKLYTNGSVGMHKDSATTITTPTTHWLLVMDTAAAPELGKFKKISPSYFATQQALIDSLDNVTQVHEPLIVLAGSDGSVPDTIAIAGLNSFGTAGQSIRINATEDGFEYYAPAGGGITSINSQTGPAISLPAGNGMQVNNTTNTVTIGLGGPLTASTIITGGGNQLSLGTTGSKLSSFAAVTTGNNTLQSDARLFLLGNITYQAAFHSSDADHTVAANTQILQLSTASLTTDRTVTLPSAVTHGQTMTITVDFASTGSHYILSSGIVDIKTGSTFTQLEWGTTYDLMVNNSLNWTVIRKY